MKLAVAAGNGGHEANDALTDLVEQLSGETEDLEDWITNPNAQTDMEALRKSGLLLPKEEPVK